MFNISNKCNNLKMNNSVQQYFSKYIKTLIVLSILVFATQCSSDEPMFIGSKKSDKYHKPECRLAKRIKPAHLLKFTSRSDAITTGYYPCKVCKP